MNKKMLLSYKSYKLSLNFIKILLKNYKKNNIYKCIYDCNLKDLFIKSINLLFKKK